MTYTILVVIVLILVSGFIAYWGDILGRRMGKKRLTLFNLRPRYTAIVVTTITGMLISALVIGAALSMNAEFRKGFFQYGQILKSRRLLARENGELALRGKKLRAEVARQRDELTDARKDAALAKAQRDKAQSYVAGLQQEIVRRQKELAELTKRADAAQDELEQRRSDVKLVQQDLRVAEESLKRAQEDVQVTQDKLEVAKVQLKATQEELSNTEVQGGWAADYAIKLRTSEIAFRQGDEIARGSIDPTRSKYEITRDLEHILDLASKKVIENGAKAGENGRAVNVIYRQIEGHENVLLMGNEEKYINRAVDKIMSSDSEVLVQIVCGMSSLTDAQVPVAIRLYLNRLVYANGDKIAQTIIDGSRSDGSILVALNGFLQSDVAKTAAQAGVVPVTGQDARDALGNDREAQADELLGLVAEIRSVNATASLSVYATAGIRAADSLNTTNIRFAVAKAK